MSYSSIKAFARGAGLYRQARWVHRHVVNRSDLRRFRREYDLYRQFIRPGDLCFDVGANYGLKTEVFLALGARVVAFEPQEDCCREITDRNPKATVLCVAIGSSPGKATLYIDRHRTGSSVVKGWRESVEDTAEVPVMTLDAAIQEYGVPTFCKIDVEGFDLEVLKGLSSPISALSYEFHRTRIDAALDCLDYLQKFGTAEVNITGAESPEFACPDWMTLSDAKVFLKCEVARADGYEWGDIFVRLLNRASAAAAPLYNEMSWGDGRYPR